MPVRQAKVIIESNRDSIRMLAGALREQESLEGDEIKALLVKSGATRV